MPFGAPASYFVEVSLHGATVEEFLKQCLEAVEKLGWTLGQTYETGFSATITHPESTWAEEFTLNIKYGVAAMKSQSSSDVITDLGQNQINIKSFLHVLEHGDLNQELIEEIKADEQGISMPGQLPEEQPEDRTEEGFKIEKDKEKRKEKLFSLVGVFKPIEGYFVTPLIIDLNILLFTIMVLNGASILQPESKVLLDWGANYRPLTLDGQWWRLITACFLHIGIMHLLFNMYALFYIGFLLEPLLGKKRFFAAYMLTGVVASMASLYWHQDTICAGASGAIFGMYGVFLALLTTKVIEKNTRKAFLTSILLFVFYNLANGTKQGIDNAAHMGGLLSGIVIGYAFYPSLVRPHVHNIVNTTIVLLTAITISGCYYGFHHISNDMGEYDKMMQEFSDNETEALRVFHVPEGTSSDSLKALLKDGDSCWYKNLDLLNHATALKLPDQVLERNGKLVTYCEFRLHSFHLLEKLLSDEKDSAMYNDSINLVNREINSLITNMNSDN